MEAEGLRKKTGGFRVPRWVRLTAAVTPFVWIFWKVDLGSLSASVRQTSWWTIPVYSILLIQLMTLQGVRWWILVHAFLPSVSLKKTLVCHFSGIYYSIVLPTSGAQDFVRSYLLSKQADYGIVWGATWISRLLGLVVLCAFTFAAMLVIENPVVIRVRPLVLAAGALVALGLFLSFSKRLTRHLRPIVRRVLPSRLQSVVEHIREAIYRYRLQPGGLARATAVTLLMQTVNVLSAAVLLLGITGRFYMLEIMIIVPAIELVCITLPLTPGGIGVREGLVALFFRILGLDKPQIAAYVSIGLLAVLLKFAGVFFLPFLPQSDNPQEQV